MRKINSLIVIIFSFMLFTLQVSAAYNPDESGIVYTQIAGTPYYVNNANYNVNPFNAVVGQLNYISPQLRALFRQEGVKLYYTEGVSRESRPGNALTGSAIVRLGSNNKVLGIDRRVRVYVYDNMQDNSVVVHEYGHVMDRVASYITGTYYE